MPFAGYTNFDDCVNKVMKEKGWDNEKAAKYCGAIKDKVEKAAVLDQVEKQLQKNQEKLDNLKV